jgi:hypothetical protein
MSVEKEEIVVKRAPLFPRPTTNVSPTDFLRNFWCRYYDTCLQEASDRHSYLSCSLCGYKANHHFDGTFESSPPSRHFPRL